MKLQNLKKSLVLIVVAVVLVCAFLFMGFSPANFADTELANEQNIATIEECTNAAKVWLSQNYNDGTEIGDIIPIIEGDETSAYCVNFQLNNKPNGYVVVNTNKNSGECIKEFGLSGEGIYETLVDNYNANGYGNLSQKREKKIFSTGLFEYAIPTDNNTCYTTNNENIALNIIKELSSKINSFNNTQALVLTEKQEYYNGFYNGSNLIPARFKYGALTGIETFTPSVMDDFLPFSAPNGQVVNLGNCSVTAATNLVSYYAEKRGFANLLINNSRQATYDEFVKLSGFKTYLPESANKNQEGLNINQINSAINKYVKNRGYKYSSDSYWFNLWSDWRRDINNGYPVYTAIRGNKLDKNGNWQEVGHAVIGVGYREYQINDEIYLRVLDGWNRTSDRYIYFNSNYFTSKNGIAMKVKVK